MTGLTGDARVFVAGVETLIGRAIADHLQRIGSRVFPAAGEQGPDLRDRASVDGYVRSVRPTHVFLAAGRSAGIRGNQRYPADLILDNLLVECHVIDAAFRHGALRLLYLASSCSYPKHAAQPMAPSSLLTGPLEPTSQSYAVAKIVGIELCAAYRRQHGCHFIAAIPADAFGPGDDFSADDSHVVAALIRRMHDARQARASELVVWGSGNQRRDFVFVDDLASACVEVMRRYDDPEPINLTAGCDLSIRELAESIRTVVGFRGALRFDTSRPDGMPRKSLDGTRLKALGWKPATSLDDAIGRTYEWFVAHADRQATHAAP